MSKKLLNRTNLVASNTPLVQPSASAADFKKMIVMLSNQVSASAQLGKRGAEDQSGSSGTSSKDTGREKTTGIVRITNIFTTLFH